MPPKKSKAKKAREDRVSEEALMYPVFVTADIPTEVLDEFITQAYEGTYAMVDDGDVGGAICILTTTDLEAYEHGSRVPTKPFKSPFLGKTVDEVREWMSLNDHEAFAESTFTILNEDTVKNKTTLIGHMGKDKRLLKTDFYGTLFCRVPIEMSTMSWDEEELVGTETVYDKAYIDAME